MLLHCWNKNFVNLQNSSAVIAKIPWNKILKSGYVVPDRILLRLNIFLFPYRHAFRQTLCGKKRRRNNPQQQLGVAGESMANRPQNSQHRSYIFKSNLRQHHHGGMYCILSKRIPWNQLGNFISRFLFFMKIQVLFFHIRVSICS